LGLFSFGLSVFALSALMLFPALAQAESSAGAEYEEAISGPYGGNKPVHKEPSAHSSNDGGNTSPGSKSPTSSEKGSSGESPSSKTEGTSGGGGTGQGNPESGSTGGKAPPVNQSGQAQPAAQSAPHSDGGGSSPLVPILIAIAALAAISIGAVMLRAKRQQRSGSGRPVSPEAS
jgi:cobalamin biosynthesis Mg chelatase CobN